MRRHRRAGSGVIVAEEADGDRAAEPLAAHEGGQLGARRGLSEGSAGQKWSPALTGSRALDQRPSQPAELLPLIACKHFAGLTALGSRRL